MYICLMATDLSIQAQRFKKVREKENMTQAEFADVIGINNSTADIERGKTKITGKIVAELLRQFNINPLWLYGYSNHMTLQAGGNTSPKVITMNSEERENILMVPIKASAGYAANVQDTDWYQELPIFNIPLPQYQDASYRAFQVRGDSMVPALAQGEWVLAKAVESTSYANNERIHVVVSDDTVVVKKLKKTERPDVVNLISLNRDYPVIEMDVMEIKELWEVNSKLSFDVDAHENNDSLITLKQGLDSLRQEISALKNSKPN